MNKGYLSLLILFLAGILIISGCRPPEVEGVVVDLQSSNWESALSGATSAVEKYPENAEAWFYYGFINAEHKKDYSEMNRAFAKVTALNPAQPVSFQGSSLPAKDAIEQYVGNQYADTFNPAIKRMQKANAEEDEANKTGALEEVRTALNTAKSIDPSRFETYQPLAMANLTLGDTAAAEKGIEEGLAINPDNVNLLLTAGEIYSMTKNTPKAVKTLTKVLELDPDNSLVYQRLGNLESANDNWDKAQEHYARAIELDPDNKDLAYNIAVGYYKQENYAAAVPYFLKSIDPNGADPLVYKLLGICYVQTEALAEEGIAFLEESVQLFPEEASLWEYLALIYGKHNMPTKAEQAFNRSKQLKGEG